MLTANYEFPVVLKKLQTVDGTPVPHSRAVVRTDTDEAISTVSDRYRLYPHADLMEQIGPYMQELGEPERRLHLERRGARFVAEYVFKSHQIEVGTNHLALRVIVRNAYQTGYAVHIQVATIVLECLNLGIFTEKTVFDATVRHAGEQVKLELPKPEALLAAFTGGQQVFRKYSAMELTLDDGVAFLEDDKVKAALPDSSLTSVGKLWSGYYGEGQRSVWDLLQHTTYEITHNSPRLSFTGRHQRLTRMARLFNHAFAGY